MANGKNRSTSLGLRHSEALVELQRYRLLVESVQDYAIFLMDPNGIIQTWNKGANKIKGYKPVEIIGRHFSTFYLPQDKESHKPERELELAKRFGRIEDEDWRIRKDGSKFWANVIITALYDETDSLVGFAKVTRDLTERKMQEDKMREANIILRQHQAELEQLNASKDEFISLASHQLRTPATGVKQHLGMLIEGFMGELEPNQLKCVLQAYENNERQISIVNSLLKVAQLDAGKITLKKQLTDVAELVSSIASNYADKFSSRDQCVELDLSQNLQSNVDGIHYRMALENIIDNASKYTAEGGRIIVSGRKDKDGLRITVKDEGVGIAAEDIPRLFKKFTRIPNVLSESVGGSGLGLYWANKIILLHGGKIEVESIVGKGTAFHVWAPME